MVVKPEQSLAKIATSTQLPTHCALPLYQCHQPVQHATPHHAHQSTVGSLVLGVFALLTVVVVFKPDV